jgi:pimeloyl-ACP methyl ester carboxylesterase
VLCATSRTFASRPEERLRFAGLAGMAIGARAVPAQVKRAAAARVLGGRSANPTLEGWLTYELQRSDWSAVLEAGAALGRFDSRPWIGEVDVPTAVVVTVRDGLVAPQRQLALARSIPGATVHPVQGDHTVCVTAPGRFVPALLEACGSVAARTSVRI